MSKKTKKGPHPHDKKEQQQIAGCPRCRGRAVFEDPARLAALVTGANLNEAADMVALAEAQFETVALADTSGLAPLEVLPLSSVPLEAEPDKAPEAPPVAPVGFSPH